MSMSAFGVVAANVAAVNIDTKAAVTNRRAVDAIALSLRCECGRERINDVAVAGRVPATQ